MGQKWVRGWTYSAELLDILHQFFQRFDVVLRMHGILEAAQLVEVGLYIFRAEAFIRSAAYARRTLPVLLAHPAAAACEHAGGFLALLGAQVDHQRTDQLGLEILDRTGREQALPHARTPGRGDGVAADV